MSKMKNKLDSFAKDRKDIRDKKLKVLSADIIVTGTKDKPYFEIKYKEVGKNHYNIGYSSYCLDHVFEWKNEYFTVVKKKNVLKQYYKK